MHAEEVRAHVRQHPFVPFRLYVSDGARYDVLHHDFVFVTARRIMVAIGAPTADHLPQRSVEIDPLHITRIEPLDRAGNGRRSRRKKV